jgi:arabinoxylan arabinofuranohydrolase
MEEASGVRYFWKIQKLTQMLLKFVFHKLKLSWNYFSIALTLAILGMPSVGFADYPLVSHRYLADPDGLEYNGRLYIYCSNDDDNSTNGGYAMHSIVCISSDDLKNWTDHGVVFQVPQNASWASYSWAPTAIFRNGLFYLYFGNNTGGIGVATNSSPTGTFVDARGSALVNSSTPGAPGTNGLQEYFDPCVFLDNNQAYLYFGGNGSNNARVVSLNANMTSVGGSATTLGTVPFFLEASHMHQHSGIYYFSYETGGSQGEWIKYMTNSNPTSGFTYVGDVLQAPHNGNNNHQAFLTFQGAEYVAYHNRYVAEQNGLTTTTYKRNVALDGVTYNSDGTIQQVVCTTNGLTQLKYLNPYNRTEAETMAQQSGIYTEPCSEGGMDVTNIVNGNWIMVRGVDFTSAGATNFTARIATAGSGGNIELRLDSLNGTLIGTCPAPATGGWQSWISASCSVDDAAAKGVHDLYLKFTGDGGDLFNFNWWQFQPSINTQSPVASVKFEAEAGVLGSDFAVSNSTSPAYITITTDDTGNIPSNSMRVATYTVTFPTAGTYQLYAHVRVGPGGFNDDSLFYGNGFGIKNPINSSDWILVNGLAGVGFNNPTNVVTGGGTLGSGIWKWINLSLFAPGPTFTVTSGNLTQIFQIGAREDGLDMDAFVFGLSSYTFTVSNLDAGVDGTPPSAGICNVNWTNRLQRIDGFGGGVVFLDAGLDPMSSANMDTLFNMNNSNQLGLTILRVRIAPNSTWSNSVSPWTMALSDAQKAVARGGRAMATPWTPPATMKTNNNTIGGALATNQYANYANYLNSFAGYMKSGGVQLAAISLQNEPDANVNYESCFWSGAQFQTFCRSNAFAITNAPVMMPESESYNFSYSDPALNDSIAVTNVSIIAGHLYGVTTIQDYPLAHNKGKPTWMTEYLVNDQTIDTAIATAQQIHDCLTTGNMSAYVWWKCIGDANGLISSNGVPQKRGFVMAQFSRFVRPGFNRIATTNNGGTLITAYRNTNSTDFVIVAINPTGISLTPTINLQNFPVVASVTPWMTSPDVSLAIQPDIAVTNSAFTYALPGLSVATFVGHANNPPALAAVADQTINAGITLMVTNAATDLDLPAQTLTFSLLSSPTNANLTMLNSSNALITWRPLVSQAGTTNLITVKVADNGSPSLSATNSFTVTLNPLSSLPSMNFISAMGGSFDLAIAGPMGPDYTISTSTNLFDWQSLITINSPATPFTLTVTNQNDPARFYRIQIGP